MREVQGRHAGPAGGFARIKLRVEDSRLVTHERSLQVSTEVDLDRGGLKEFERYESQEHKDEEHLDRTAGGAERGRPLHVRDNTGACVGTLAHKIDAIAAGHSFRP